eukprot:TRINITY_DN20796_c0_g1_i1.p1 TRINITY_DN20796_c0_g1~~TRINITY_DN20796_c0_g1_i1.p1  ORF type:complete len:716 (-),score=138.54 TRINITY_DN20796_c0_g1_i1:153-2162(-)
MEAMEGLNEQDMKDMGLKLGSIKKILKGLELRAAQLQSGASPVAAGAPSFQPTSPAAGYPSFQSTPSPSSPSGPDFAEMSVSAQAGLSDRLAHDVTNEPLQARLPLDGLDTMVIVSLEEAAQRLQNELDHAHSYAMACIQLVNNRKATGEIPAAFNDDCAGAIAYFTAQWKGPSKSFYYKLNGHLRKEDRKALTPFMAMLKLIVVGFCSLDRFQGHVWRGVKEDLHKKYDKGTVVTWWALGSSTTSAAALEEETFLGKTGDRTLFSIHIRTGFSVKAFSWFKNEEEILLPPGLAFEVEDKLDLGNGLWMIMLREAADSPFCIVPTTSSQILVPTFEQIPQSRITSTYVAMTEEVLAKHPIVGKVLLAMKHNVFLPASPEFDMKWTARTAPTVDVAQVIDLIAEQVPVGASPMVHAYFALVLGKIAEGFERWNMMNLQMLQHFDSGLKTLKHEACLEILKLASFAARAIPQTSCPSVVMWKANERGFIVGFDMHCPKDAEVPFNQHLVNSLRLNDVKFEMPLTIPDVAKRLYNFEPWNGWRTGLSYPESLSETDGLRLLHTQLRLFCGVPALLEGDFDDGTAQFLAANTGLRLIVRNIADGIGDDALLTFVRAAMAQTHSRGILLLIRGMTRGSEVRSAVYACDQLMAATSAESELTVRCILCCQGDPKL